MPQIDRNMRARALFHAEALDRRSHRDGQHGGAIKRTGIAVYKALLGYACAAGGFCYPTHETIARAAGVARSTVAEALKRLEAAGLVERVRRQVGTVRLSNFYRFVLPDDPSSGRAAEPSDSRKAPKSDSRSKRTNQKKTYPESARSVPAAPAPRPGRAAILASAQRLGIPLRPDPAAG